MGWYNYICEDCAIAEGRDYRKDGKLYREGVELPEPEAPVPAESGK